MRNYSKVMTALYRNSTKRWKLLIYNAYIAVSNKKTKETMKPYTYVDVNANYLNHNEEFLCREVVATTHAEQDSHHQQH